MPLRLAIFLIVVAVILITRKEQSEIYLPFLIYSLTTLGLLISLAFRLPARAPRVAQMFIMLQILSEVFVEAAVIRLTGEVTSPFTALFLLTIVSAAYVYRLWGTLLTATFVSIAYAIVIWTGSGEPIPQDIDLEVIQNLFAGNDEQFYTLFLYICIFYLVAFVSGYLSQRIQAKESELKAASESLARVKLETDEILKHLHSGLITIDHFGRIIYFNQAAERITGYSESKIKGRNCLEAFADRMPEFSEKILSVLKSSQHEHRCEISITDENGRSIPIGISTSVLEDETRGVRGVIGIFQDLTDAKVIETKMRRADRLAAVGELSASIAHEIRNPLAAISGSVEILRNELQVEGENQKLMNLIVKEASRLSNILTDFLVYARVKQPAFNKVEINRLVSDILDLIQQRPNHNKGVRLNSNSDDTTVYVKGDEEQLKQVLINLVVNAIDALGTRKGRVEVEIVSDSIRYPDQIILRVKDDGAGMTPEVQDNIFTPFYSTKKEGTGLGLAIVKRLVENMGGKITVESSQNSGTTFEISLLKYMDSMPRRGADQDEELYSPEESDYIHFSGTTPYR